MNMSKLMKQAEKILQSEGQDGMNRWLDTLSPSEIEQLKNDCIDWMASYIGQTILAHMHQSIENNIPLKGFSRN